MIVVGCTQTKGGAGKTTLSQCIAIEAVRDGKNVELMDLDPAQSLTKWWRRRGGPPNPILAVSGKSTAELLLEVERKSHPDVVVIDTPGELLTVIRDAVTASDVIVVPIAPSIKDWEAMDSCQSILNSAGKRDFALYVVNRYRANTHSSIDIRRALHERTGAIPLTVALATDHERADALGQTGAEINTRIAGEIGILWQEIKRIAMNVKKQSIHAA